MHVKFEYVNPRRQPGKQERRRAVSAHLRVLVVLPGRRRVQLASMAMPVQPTKVAAAIAQSMARLRTLCESTDDLDRLVRLVAGRFHREGAVTLGLRNARWTEIANNPPRPPTGVPST